MSKYLSILIVNLLFAINLFGQASVIAEVQMPAVRGKRVKKQQVVLPSSLTGKLTKLLIVKDREKRYTFQNVRLEKLFQKIPLYRVAEYSDIQTRIIKNKDGTFTAVGGMVSHPSWYPALYYNYKLYVFRESHSDVVANTEIFNLFLKEANLRIESEKEAIELANLYLSITRGYFENKGKLILSSVEDLPPPFRNGKESEMNALREIVAAPKSTRVGDNYEVELYTWEIFRGEVSRWTFKIQSDAHIEVQSEIIGKL